MSIVRSNTTKHVFFNKTFILTKQIYSELFISDNIFYISHVHNAIIMTLVSLLQVFVDIAPDFIDKIVHVFYDQVTLNININIIFFTLITVKENSKLVVKWNFPKK